MLACAGSFDQPTWCSESWIKSPLSLGFDFFSAMLVPQLTKAVQVYSAAIQGILLLTLSFKPVQCVHREDIYRHSILNHPVQYVIVILLHQVVDLPRVVSLIKFIVMKLSSSPN